MFAAGSASADKAIRNGLLPVDAMGSRARDVDMTTNVTSVVMGSDGTPVATDASARTGVVYGLPGSSGLDQARVVAAGFTAFPGTRVSNSAQAGASNPLAMGGGVSVYDGQNARTSLGMGSDGASGFDASMVTYTSKDPLYNIRVAMPKSTSKSGNGMYDPIVANKPLLIKSSLRSLSGRFASGTEKPATDGTGTQVAPRSFASDTDDRVPMVTTLAEANAYKAGDVSGILKNLGAVVGAIHELVDAAPGAYTRAQYIAFAATHDGRITEEKFEGIIGNTAQARSNQKRITHRVDELATSILSGVRVAKHAGVFAPVADAVNKAVVAAAAAAAGAGAAIPGAVKGLAIGDSTFVLGIAPNDTALFRALCALAKDCKDAGMISGTLAADDTDEGRAYAKKVLGLAYYGSLLHEVFDGALTAAAYRIASGVAGAETGVDVADVSAWDNDKFTVAGARAYALSLCTSMTFAAAIVRSRPRLECIGVAKVSSEDPTARIDIVGERGMNSEPESFGVGAVMHRGYRRNKITSVARAMTKTTDVMDEWGILANGRAVGYACFCVPRIADVKKLMERDDAGLFGKTVVTDAFAALKLVGVGKDDILFPMWLPAPVCNAGVTASLYVPNGYNFYLGHVGAARDAGVYFQGDLPAKRPCASDSLQAFSDIAYATDSALVVPIGMSTERSDGVQPDEVMNIRLGNVINNVLVFGTSDMDGGIRTNGGCIFEAAAGSTRVVSVSLMPTTAAYFKVQDALCYKDIADVPAWRVATNSTDPVNAMFAEEDVEKRGKAEAIAKLFSKNQAARAGVLAELAVEVHANVGGATDMDAKVANAATARSTVCAPFTLGQLLSPQDLKAILEDTAITGSTVAITAAVTAASTTVTALASVAVSPPFSIDI